MSAPARRVGDVLRLERVAVEPDPRSEYVSIGIRSFGKGIFHYEPKPGDQLGSLRFFELRPNRLVVSNIKGWEGAIAVSGDADAHTVASNRFLTYAPIDDEIDVRWARWYFLSERGIAQIQRASPGSADRNRTLAIERFEALEIPLPSIDEQRRQARLLDDLARASDEVSTALAAQTASALIAALPSFVDDVIDELHAPSGAVADLVDFVSDTVHPGDDPGFAEEFVGLQHVESHTGRRVGSEPLGPMKGRKFRFRPGDILYGYLRPYLNKVWVADRHGLCSVDQYVLRPRDGVNGDLIAHALRGRRILDRSIELTHSLQLPRLRSGLLGAIEVPHIGGVVAVDAVRRLDVLRDKVVMAASLRERQDDLAKALIPSGMNSVLSRVE